MVRERCWKCNVVKSGVELRACDDRLCYDCFEENELALKHPQMSDNKGTMHMAAAETFSTVCCDRSDLKQVLTCIVCDEKYHGVCVGISVPVVAALLKIVSTTGWVCLSCRSIAKKQIEKLFAEQSCLSLEVAQLKTDVSKLQQTVESNHQLVLNKCHNKDVAAWSQQVDGNVLEWPRLQRTVAAEIGVNKSAENVLLAKVHNELNDKQRRARNVVVRGLMHIDGVDDLDVFASFCERNLPVKPAIDKCRRIGKTLPGKVQPLLVVLKNETAVTELLNCTPRLRTSTDETVKSVFINRDLTAAQALAAYQLRAARRLQRQQQVVEQSHVDNSNSSGTVFAGQPDFELHVNAGNLAVLPNNELSVNAANFVPTSNAGCIGSCV